MAKRGRKPSTQRKGYFYEEQEKAIADYLKSTDDVEKNRIYSTILHPALSNMIESIIRRYSLYCPDEEFEETFNDTISYLMTKIEKFRPESGFKAYSYCGTVCKNYLLYKIKQGNKHLQKNASYNVMSETINDSIEYSYDEHEDSMALIKELMTDMAGKTKEILANASVLELSENEIKVGNALYELLLDWDDLFARMGSNKFNKSSVLFFLRESTMLNTKEIREGMKRYKNIYYDLKEKLVNRY